MTVKPLNLKKRRIQKSHLKIAEACEVLVTSVRVLQYAQNYCFVEQQHVGNIRPDTLACGRSYTNAVDLDRAGAGGTTGAQSQPSSIAIKRMHDICRSSCMMHGPSSGILTERRPEYQRGQNDCRT